MKSFKISNLVTKILFSSEKTKKLINEGILRRAAGATEGGEKRGSEIFSKKISRGTRLFGN